MHRDIIQCQTWKMHSCGAGLQAAPHLDSHVGCGLAGWHDFSTFDGLLGTRHVHFSPIQKLIHLENFPIIWFSWSPMCQFWPDRPIFRSPSSALNFACFTQFWLKKCLPLPKILNNLKRAAHSTAIFLHTFSINFAPSATTWKPSVRFF